MVQCSIVEVPGNMYHLLGVLQSQRRESNAGVDIGNDHEIYLDAKDPVRTGNCSL
jgi:hypothetical protein